MLTALGPAVLVFLFFILCFVFTKNRDFLEMSAFFGVGAFILGLIISVGILPGEDVIETYTFEEFARTGFEYDKDDALTFSDSGEERVVVYRQLPTEHPLWSINNGQVYNVTFFVGGS